jgi:hypothetical protein
VVIDEHGAVRATRAWGVYGAQRSAVGVEARGLHGHRIEAGLGLLDAGARHLVGGLGQFGQVEPLLLEGPGGAMLLEPLRMSAYRYGLNAPTSFVDRDGRMVESPLDFMLSGYSVGKAILNPTKDNVVAAVVDVAAAATPFVPAVYGLGMRNADEVMEVINTFGKVSDPAATAVKAAPPIGAVPVGAGAASRPVRNAHLAGKSHPVTGIPFDSAGFPDFSSVSQANVQITYSGSRTADFAAANKAAGLQSTPKGMTWHHHQDGTTMQLVPTDIHSATGHTGGFSLP